MSSGLFTQYGGLNFMLKRKKRKAAHKSHKKAKRTKARKTHKKAKRTAKRKTHRRRKAGHVAALIVQE